MKITFYLISLCIIFIVAICSLLYFKYQTSALFEGESGVKIEVVDGKYRIKLPELEKEAIKSFLRRIAKKVYYKATVYNPSGDILPDSIDDRVIGELKKRIE